MRQEQTTKLKTELNPVGKRIERCRAEQRRCIEELKAEHTQSEVFCIKMGLFDWIIEELLIYESTREVPRKHSNDI
jgi:hypothetical protein